MAISVGEIWSHSRFYLDPVSGNWKPKYLLILAVSGGDIVYRLLTSKEKARPKSPGCSHQDPHPSFFLGIPGGPLNRETWLDLREANDFDSIDFDYLVRIGLLTLVLHIPQSPLCEALLCAANAPDTRTQQRKRIYASRSTMACP